MKERTLRSDFKFNIGDIIKDNSRNLQIIDRKRARSKNGTMQKYYKYKCLNCGWDCGFHFNYRLNCYNNDFWVVESNLSKKKGSGCACCNNKVVIKNINNLTYIYPETKKFLVDEKDGDTHTPRSNMKIMCKCPICNNKKVYSITNLIGKGFSCNVCGDGISYPEKVMSNILFQLNIDYSHQFLIKDKSKRYLYDFYFKLNNNKYIIEVNGIQHYEENNFSFGNHSLELEKQNDKNKKDCAIRYGIKESNYIVIDARKSNINFIRNNILNSKLNEILMLKNIDWNLCDLYASKSILLEICKYWKDNYPNISIKNLEEKYKLSKSTIFNYLKKGHDLKLCKYNGDFEKLKNFEKHKQINTHGKQVEIFKDGISYGKFRNCVDLERKSEELFNIKLNSSNISAVCTGYQKTHKGFTFKYV